VNLSDYYTNKFYTTASNLTAAIKFASAKLFKPRYWMAALIAGVIGSVLGAVFAHFTNTDFLDKFLPIFILVAALGIFMPNKHIGTKRQTSLSEYTKPNGLWSGLWGSIIGFYSGFIGAGSAVYWVSICMNVFKTTLLEASAAARLMATLTNVFALMSFAYFNDINYSIGIAIAISGSLGSFIGSHFAIKFGEKLIKPTMLTSLLTMCGYTFYKAWLV